jgi:hypothetical protein
MSLSPVMCVMCHVLSCRLASMTCLLLTHTRVNLCLTSLTSLRSFSHWTLASLCADAVVSFTVR